MSSHFISFAAALNHGLYFQANRIFLTKNKACIAFVDEWWSVMTDNYFTFDSSTIQEFPEKPTFIQTRDDQTILNFVLLKHNMLNTSSMLPGVSKNAGKVFIAARNKTGESKYK